MAKALFNLAIFQVGWFACVLFGNLPALLYTGVALLLHGLYLLNNNREWLVILMVAGAGICWDIILAGSGVLNFPQADFLGLPLWLLCLWLLFATTFSHCLSWLQNHLMPAGLLAAFFGPATYWGGSYLSDVWIAPPLFSSLVIMACGWLVLFPLGLYWARRLNPCF